MYRFGKQEDFMSALNKRHFELRESASDDKTILDAVEEVGACIAREEMCKYFELNLHDSRHKMILKTVKGIRVYVCLSICVVEECECRCAVSTCSSQGCA
jgi:hypothetical protein